MGQRGIRSLLRTFVLQRTGGGASPSCHQLEIASRIVKSPIFMMFQMAVPPHPD